MPPTPEDRLTDITESIADITQMLRGMSLEEFVANRTVRMATERYLEIICEAARRLPEELKNAEPGIDWKRMVDFGNLLRHAYHSTKAEKVWEIVQDDLRALDDFAARTLRARNQQARPAG